MLSVGCPPSYTSFYRHVAPSTRLLAIEFIVALSSASEQLRDLFLELGAVPLIADCEIVARTEASRGWDILLEPAHLCFQVLRGSVTGDISVSPPLAERFGFGPNALVRRIFALPSQSRHLGCPVTVYLSPISIEWITEVACYGCGSCHKRLLFDVSPEFIQDFRDLLGRLMLYTR